MAKKNQNAVALQKLGVKATRRKYGKDFWKRIRRGERPSQAPIQDTPQIADKGAK